MSAPALSQELRFPWCLRTCRHVYVSGRQTTYVVVKELHHKGCHAAVDTDEEVEAGQHHVGRAGHAEDEGGGVHHRGDGPPAEKETLLSHEETKRGSKDPLP